MNLEYPALDRFLNDAEDHGKWVFKEQSRTWPVSCDLSVCKMIKAQIQGLAQDVESRISMSRDKLSNEFSNFKNKGRINEVEEVLVPFLKKTLMFIDRGGEWMLQRLPI